MKKMKMRTRNIILFALFVFFGCNQDGMAQMGKHEKLDSLRKKFVKDSAHIFREKKVRPLIAYDTRNSFIHNANDRVPVNLAGVQIGVVIAEHHSMGTGFYAMSPVSRQVHSVKDNSRDINVQLSMGYVNAFYEYEIIDTRWWEIGIFSESGIGNYHLTATDPKTNKKDTLFADTLKHPFSLFATGVNIDLKLIRYVGLNVMGGVRIVAGNEPNKVNFNGAFYSYGVNFYFGEMVKSYKYFRKKKRYKKAVKLINRT